MTAGDDTTISVVQSDQSPLRLTQPPSRSPGVLRPPLTVPAVHPQEKDASEIVRRADAILQDVDRARLLTYYGRKNASAEDATVKRCGIGWDGDGD